MSANGRLTESELTTVVGVQLANIAARAFSAMSSACLDEMGRNLFIEEPAGGYRSYFTQGDMRTRPDRFDYYNLSRYSTVPLALPGYSKHGWGLCADIAHWPYVAGWVLTNMHRWGFTRPFGKSDPNHLLHDGKTAPALAPASTPNAAPFTEEEDMYTNDDRARDDRTAWNVTQIKATLDNIAAGRGVLNAKLDNIGWAVSDPAQGLRAMVAGITGETAAPVDVSAIAKAVQDEEDRRDLARLSK